MRPWFRRSRLSDQWVLTPPPIYIQIPIWRIYAPINALEYTATGEGGAVPPWWKVLTAWEKSNHSTTATLRNRCNKAIIFGAGVILKEEDSELSIFFLSEVLNVKSEEGWRSYILFKWKQCFLGCWGYRTSVWSLKQCYFASENVYLYKGMEMAIEETWPTSQGCK